MPRLIDAHEVYKYLRDLGGCDAEPGSWSDGWDEAIYAAICGLDWIPVADPIHFEGGCYCWECENADPYMCVGTPTDDVNASLFRCYKYDGIYRTRYDFCSRGERREEND